jgi:fatty-acyl-CoA synthase
MQLNYSHGVSPRPLIGKTIGDWLDEAAAEFGPQEALVSVFENKRFSYSSFREEVDRCARALIALGVEKGARVGLWSTNCTDWTLLQFGTAKIGAVLVNINPSYRLHELEFALKQSECNVLISGEGFKDADYVAMLHQLVPELASADPRKDLRREKFPAPAATDLPGRPAGAGFPQLERTAQVGRARRARRCGRTAGVTGL